MSGSARERGKGAQRRLPPRRTPCLLGGALDRTIANVRRQLQLCEQLVFTRRASERQFELGRAVQENADPDAHPRRPLTCRRRRDQPWTTGDGRYTRGTSRSGRPGAPQLRVDDGEVPRLMDLYDSAGLSRRWPCFQPLRTSCCTRTSRGRRSSQTPPPSPQVERVRLHTDVFRLQCEQKG